MCLDLNNVHKSTRPCHARLTAHCDASVTGSTSSSNELWYKDRNLIGMNAVRNDLISIVLYSCRTMVSARQFVQDLGLSHFTPIEASYIKPCAGHTMAVFWRGRELELCIRAHAADCVQGARRPTMKGVQS